MVGPAPYTALAAELASPGYAGLDDATAAALLVEPIPTVRAVATVDARSVLLKTPWWAAIAVLAEQAGSPARAAAITVRDTLLHTATLDTDDPAVLAGVEALLDALVSAGALDLATKADLLALTDHTTTRAEQIGWTFPPSADDVAAARRL